MDMRIKNGLLWILIGLLLIAGTTACAEAVTEAQNDETAVSSPTEEATGSDTAVRPAGWTTETHSNEADPNYDVVFPDDQVNQITITIAPEDWAAMQANMVDLFGEAGTGGNAGGRGVPGDFQPPEGDRPQPGAGDFPEGFQPPEGGMPDRDNFDGNGRPGGGFGGGDMTPDNPMWVPATIEFNGLTWNNVGVRYKGNSSLTSGWRSGDAKLPLKLDFDEFEDEYPEIDNQRFYGFKQLSLANGFSDASFLRDAVTADILAEAGLPAAETAFYEITLDYGEGPVSLGLYTAIEVIDDTVVERVFGSDDGNIYEAEGSAASFAASTYNQIADSFEKENNEDEADWSDLEALFDVLHDEQRISDPAAWRANLESLFDVDYFLEWLAISAVIQNWDAYGSMSHNYYLYHDPDSGQFKWISWDHNEAMSVGMGGGGRGPGRGVTLDKTDIGDNWPLIRYLLDDPVYYEKYVGYLAETVAGPFNPDHMAETYRAMADLIAPYAATDVGATAFNEAVQTLVDHAYQRADDVAEFLAANGRS
ncbi:MAG: CotH kinase family protein [Ardenticatenaceae bacterium]|nr:CotH kinase family protein [Ardenticatenaceae bacterium]MCB8991775.1 CotH kinase family protein [Ardenticatenaceae bacterium]MCB9003614.1 CotH kinase family protein [Ardenticatenaceae bacterium]